MAASRKTANVSCIAAGSVGTAGCGACKCPRFDKFVRCKAHAQRSNDIQRASKLREFHGHPFVCLDLVGGESAEQDDKVSQCLSKCPLVQSGARLTRWFGSRRIMLTSSVRFVTPYSMNKSPRYHFTVRVESDTSRAMSAFFQPSQSNSSILRRRGFRKGCALEDTNSISTERI